MFILSLDGKSITNEQGDGYVMRPVLIGDSSNWAIACQVNNMPVFNGTEQECLDRIDHLAFALDAYEWHSTGALRSCNHSMAGVVLSCLDSIKDDAALDALAHTASVLEYRPDCAKSIEQFVARMEQKS